jgi:trehalose-6-phosphate hydrolase
MFWIKKGVKGFRLDVINLIGKDEFLKDSIDCDSKFEYTDKPITHEYLKILNENTFGKEEGIITVGEMSSTTIENSILYTQPDRKELSMVFHFNHLKVDYNNNQKWQLKKFDVKKFISILNSWGERMSEQNGWIALFYNNHDQPRMLNRCINLQYRVEGAKMLAATIHLSRGTPYIYMGEEIGMINPEFNSIDEYVDIESINAFNEMIKNGRPKTEALEIIKARSRDNARTPMQWDASKNAGFSKAKPWLSIGNSYKEINVEKELKGDEIFNFYKKLISLRKKYKIISEGSYVSYEESNSYVYSFIRSFENNELLVINNFRHIKSNIKIDKRFLSGKVLVSNYENIKISNIIELRPYETISIII